MRDDKQHTRPARDLRKVVAHWEELARAVLRSRVRPLAHGNAEWETTMTPGDVTFSTTIGSSPVAIDVAFVVKDRGTPWWSVSLPGVRVVNCCSADEAVRRAVDELRQMIDQRREVLDELAAALPPAHGEES